MKIRPKNPPFLPQKHDGEFHNFHEHIEKNKESLLSALKMYFGSFKNFMKKPVDIDRWIQKDSVVQSSQTLISTWLGHATVLIQVAGITILTDPIFDSPTILYRRIIPFGVDIKDLPPIDVVLISHNHRDHFDESTLLYLKKHFDPVFLVPEGDKKWFIDRGYIKVEECMWWDAYHYQNNVLFTFVPAWHWSQRGLFDYNTSLWGGWVIEAAGKTIYFAGDTAYNKDYFTVIADYFKKIDVAFLPIGPGDPDAWMRRSHIDAFQAVQAFIDCKATRFLPIHWGTFYFGHDDFETPIKRLKAAWTKHQNQLQGCDLVLSKLAERIDHDQRDKSF